MNTLFHLSSDDTDHKTSSPRTYSDVLTADINEKGVLDVDTVKGCTAGMAARSEGGCYNTCYAERIAKFRGIDFTRSVARYVYSATQADSIVRAVKAAPEGFFRVGTMGDPCHAWQHTVKVVRWLAPYAVPVIVTKHWMVASDEQLEALIECGAVLNTSVSALDAEAELDRRESQAARYGAMGGVSVLRVVTCDFNENTQDGARMAAVQARLMSHGAVIDNPLRVARNHHLVKSGVIRVDVVRDLASDRAVSIASADTYVGHCNGCADKCGLSLLPPAHPRPESPQLELFRENPYGEVS